MADTIELEKRLPVAPLKVVALDSAREMGRKINQYLVDFRKVTHLDFVGDPAVIMKTIFFWKWMFPGFLQGKVKLSSTNPSGDKTCISWWM